MFPISAEMCKTIRKEIGTETVWMPVEILAFGQEGKDSAVWPVAIVRVIETDQFRHVELDLLRGVKLKCAD